MSRYGGDDETSARISVHRDGPLIVRGPVSIVGADGEAINPGRSTFALCRCGRSAIRPFCDGSHDGRFRCPGTDTRPPRQPAQREGP